MSTTDLEMLHALKRLRSQVDAAISCVEAGNVRDVKPKYPFRLAPHDMIIGDFGITFLNARCDSGYVSNL